MNHLQITRALEQLEIEGEINRGWSVAGLVIAVAAGDTVPTELELESAYSRALAVEVELAEVAAKREVMRTNFDNLDDWLRGPFYHIFETVNTLLDLADYDAAIEAVKSAEATAEILTDPNKLSAFNATKQGFVAAIEDLRDNS